VQGFKFSGFVEVIYNEGMDLFEVHLSDGRVEADVYADSLVDVIDGLVERTDDYTERVKKEYGLVNR
jgi:DNA-binding ferritin-like protein (Dps family)